MNVYSFYVSEKKNTSQETFSVWSFFFVLFLNFHVYKKYNKQGILVRDIQIQILNDNNNSNREKKEDENVLQI